MRRISVLNLCPMLVIVAAVLGQTVGQRPAGSTRTIEENTSVTLTCKDGNVTNFVSKAWYRGHYSVFITPDSDATIYNQVSSGTVGDFTTRPDISVDATNFNLTIGAVELEDDSIFTCRVATFGGETYDTVQLHVYVKPNITLRGLENTTSTENTTVTVTCTIDRIYPALRPGDFYIQLGTQNITSVGAMSAHADGSYGYTEQFTYTLTRDDDGTAVSCRVAPPRGQPVSISETITVHYLSGDPAVLVVTPSNPYTDQVVTFTCSHGEAKDNPPVDSVLWYKDGQQLPDWPENSLTHTVKVTTADSGLYSCMVGNVVGLSEISASVRVNVSTIFSSIPSASPSVVPAALGGTVGVVLVIVVIIIVIVLCARRSKKVQDNKRSRDGISHNAGFAGDSYESPMPSTTAPNPPPKDMTRDIVTPYLTTSFKGRRDGNSNNVGYAGDSYESPVPSTMAPNPPPKDMTRDIVTPYLTTSFTGPRGAAADENEYEDVKHLHNDDTNLPGTSQNGAPHPLV